MATRDVLGGWREQYDRMNRDYKRFLRASRGNQAEMLDSFFHFIQGAWHLRDWLINDPVTRPLRGAVTGYADHSGNLQMCRDLCNSTKHLVQKGTGLRYKLVVVTSEGQELDPLEFAQEVVKSWDSWLTEQALLEG